MGWDTRSRRHSTRPKFEITGVPDALMAEFSKRSAQVEEAKDELVAAFVSGHGRQPTNVEVLRMRQRATLATRPDKAHRSLAEMTADWRHRAGEYVGDTADQVSWMTGLKDRNDLPLLRADDLDGGILGDAAEATVAAVAERRSTYGRHNLLAEAARLLDGVRFASPDDRVAVAERIVELTTERSVLLTPASPHHTPRATSGRTVPPGSIRHAINGSPPNCCSMPKHDSWLQADAPTGRPYRSTSSLRWSSCPCREDPTDSRSTRRSPWKRSQPRVVDVLVGPAGTGKSTTMAGLRAAWEAHYGAGTVVGQRFSCPGVGPGISPPFAVLPAVVNRRYQRIGWIPSPQGAKDPIGARR